MRLLIVIVVAVTAGAAPQNQKDVRVLRYDVDNGGLGSYNFAYELSDGSKHDQQGELRNKGTDKEAIAVQGSYSWMSLDGVTYTTNYVADENGFQPQTSEGSSGLITKALIDSLLKLN